MRLGGSGGAKVNVWTVEKMNEKWFLKRASLLNANKLFLQHVQCILFDFSTLDLIGFDIKMAVTVLSHLDWNILLFDCVYKLIKEYLNMQTITFRVD